MIVNTNGFIIITLVYLIYLPLNKIDIIKIMRKVAFFIIFVFFAIQSFATHNRAGEITYEQLSELTYKFTLVTYTYTPSLADRPTLVLNWGDGTESTVNRISKTSLPNQVNMNVYAGTHTYTGQGRFVISMLDKNRNGGVTNILNSINEPFYIETILEINPFVGINNSPKLLNPPIDNGCVGYPFLHNPGAYDVDGDSIAYELVHCRGVNGAFIPGYFYPPATVSFSIDPITGTLTWDSPTQVGEYNVAILIKEYRNGVFVGSITRDMQITIANCNNRPPEILEINDTCIEVGQSLNILIEAVDIDNDLVTLRGTGGPLLLSTSPAIFNQPSLGQGSVNSLFSWQPDCNSVQFQPYQMVFTANDDGSPVNLVDIQSLFIKVIAPAPENLLASPKGNSVELVWDESICSNAIGYDIYRHEGYIGYIADNCETGVPAWTGYVKVGNTSSPSDTDYVDGNNGHGLMHGTDYCYMVVAVFPDGAESYPSLESCASLIKDVPVITNVTIDTTDINTGKATIIWSKPDSLDFTQTPGPFVYQIMHNTTGFGQPMILVDSLLDLNDTIYQHININTQNEKHFYKIGFVNNSPGNRFYIGETQLASSIKAVAIGKARSVELSWNPQVPWANDTFVIYKQNSMDLFDSIAFVSGNAFTDSNLVNGNTYCYYIKSIGKYSALGFSDPLINYSQIVCAVPIDEEPPCAPKLNVRTDCNLIENYLVWNNTNNTCSDDVVGYKLYYIESLNDDYNEIYYAQNANDTTYTHNGLETIVGCYYVTAIDSAGNESVNSKLACVDIDSCNLYRLPNVFTPNNDGYNDLFVPFPYDFVDEVDMNIYNRWGGLVFSTNDPDINWEGMDITTSNECTDGVYFFVCVVFENRLEGIVERTIHGTVSLYRH